jgi:prepilin-type N-terminal cleavage/methylation domain-containing protein
MQKKRKIKYFSINKTKGFTLIEVLIALAITVIGLVPLIHLLTNSIFMTDSAWNLSQATLIGNAKLAEVVAQDDIKIGTDKGNVESEEKEMAFDWVSEVTEASIEELEGMNLAGIRKVTVSVMWYEGKNQKQISLMTYVFIDNAVTKISAN